MGNQPHREDDAETAAAGAVWAERQAPSLDDIFALGVAAFEALPAAFKARAGDVALRVQDFADDDVLDELGAESPFEIMGLYQGLDRLARGAEPADTALVFLYRRAILDYWAEHEETLGDLVAHILIHEIGHHMGLSDEDMEAIEGGSLDSIAFRLKHSLSF